MRWGKTKMLEEYQHGEVREFRLALPPANALNQALVLHLTQRLRAAALDGTRAIVLSGAPGMFSAGLDVSMLITLDAHELQRFMRSVLALEQQLAVQSIPVVAALTGHCAAPATVLAMICDHRVMSAGHYKIGINEVAIGVCPGRIAYQVCRRLVGARQADRLIVRGEFVEADEALRIGLVDQLSEPDNVIAEAIAYAQSYLSLPQQAMYETRRIARQDLTQICEAAARDDADELHKLWFTAEAQQGLRALAARLAGAAVR
jgi:3,2-trans-enoyl-CoA isomerase